MLMTSRLMVQEEASYIARHVFISPFTGSVIQTGECLFVGMDKKHELKPVAWHIRVGVGADADEDFDAADYGNAMQWTRKYLSELSVVTIIRVIMIYGMSFVCACVCTGDIHAPREIMIMIMISTGSLTFQLMSR